MRPNVGANVGHHRPGSSQAGENPGEMRFVAAQKHHLPVDMLTGINFDLEPIGPAPDTLDIARAVPSAGVEGTQEPPGSPEPNMTTQQNSQVLKQRSTP